MTIPAGRESLCFRRADWEGNRRDSTPARKRQVAQAVMVLVVDAQGFTVAKDDVLGLKVPRRVGAREAVGLLAAASEVVT